jgi:translation elongation factor P/translation initiation factor 5A
MDIKQLKKGNYVVHDTKPYMVKEVQLFDKIYKVVLENLFSGEMINASFDLTQDIPEADVKRKCATILSKTEDKLEIMDMINFDTFKVSPRPEVFNQASENDQVTYIQFEDKTKVLEVRKQ